MQDSNVLGRIEKLVDEEHELLREGEKEGGLDQAGHSRLEQVGVELDRCWDLLRRRRALRDAGEDPDQAKARDAKTVEGYLG